MNLPQFLKRVDDLSDKLSSEKRAVFIHKIAQNLPESNRSDFLKLMNSLIVDSEQNIKEDIRHYDLPLKEKLRQIHIEMQKIRDRKICLMSKFNTEYDDYYSPEEDEFLFEDPDKVLPILQNACELVHAYVDAELYQEAYELGNEILKLPIYANGDYPAYAEEYMDIRVVINYELISVDLHKLFLDILYAAYQSAPLSKSAKTLYTLIENFHDDKITLSEILNVSSDETETTTEFLNIWINYLGENPTPVANRLFLEAADMIDDFELRCQIAKKYVNQHPRLYVNLINEKINEGQFETAFNLGNKALQNIPISYNIRAKAALLAVNAAMNINQIEDTERFRLEVFRSDTTPANFLSIVVESRNFSKWRIDVRNIYTKFVEDRSTPFIDYDCINVDLIRNRIEKVSFQALRFFNGYFEETINNVLYPKASLGWSKTFIKQAIALFLINMYRGDSFPVGCRNMCQSIEKSFGFNNFSDLMEKWRKYVPMSEDIQRKALDRLEKLIEQRTEGIVRNKHNYSYEETAAFIAAFGEVKESCNEGTKQEIMEVYAQEYSRFRAFRRELQNFGWKKN